MFGISLMSTFITLSNISQNNIILELIYTIPSFPLHFNEHTYNFIINKGKNTVRLRGAVNKQYKLNICIH